MFVRLFTSLPIVEMRFWLSVLLGADWLSVLLGASLLVGVVWPSVTVGIAWPSVGVELAPVPERGCDTGVSDGVACGSDAEGCSFVAESVAELPVSPVAVAAPEGVSEGVAVALLVDSKLFTAVFTMVVKPSERFSDEVEPSLGASVAAGASVLPVALAVSELESSKSDNALARPSVALAVLEADVVFVSTCLLISRGK